MSIMMLVAPYAEGMRATGNAKILVQTVPKTSISYVHSYFTANTSGATSGNVQCWPTNFGSTTLAANTLANTPPVSLIAGQLTYHNYMSDQLSSGVVIGRNFVVNLYAGNTAVSNTGATVFPPNNAVQRVITIAPEGNDAGGNTWGGYREWDVADATVTFNNNQGISGANTVRYQWALSSNSNRPWQFTGSAGADVGSVVFIYQF